MQMCYVSIYARMRKQHFASQMRLLGRRGADAGDESGLTSGAREGLRGDWGSGESVEQVAAGHVFRDQQDGVVLDADAQKPDDILGMGSPQDRHLRNQMSK